VLQGGERRRRQVGGGRRAEQLLDDAGQPPGGWFRAGRSAAAEREQLGIDRGVMVLAVRSADGERVWPADQYVIEVTAATGRRGGSR
jgi:hypothetical protein